MIRARRFGVYEVLVDFSSSTVYVCLSLYPCFGRCANFPHALGWWDSVPFQGLSRHHQCAPKYRDTCFCIVIFAVLSCTLYVFASHRFTSVLPNQSHPDPFWLLSIRPLQLLNALSSPRMCLFRVFIVHVCCWWFLGLCITSHLVVNIWRHGGSKDRKDRRPRN
jgi:hypothetical protein